MFVGNVSKRRRETYRDTQVTLGEFPLTPHKFHRFHLIIFKTKEDETYVPYGRKVKRKRWNLQETMWGQRELFRIVIAKYNLAQETPTQTPPPTVGRR